MDEITLRRKAREAIQSQKIPDRPPDRLWGGPGTGAACVICGRPLGREDMGFDVEFIHPDGGGVLNFPLHIRCFAVWELERDTAQGPPEGEAANGKAGSNGTFLSTNGTVGGLIKPRRALAAQADPK
jgi:hypothetical protein